MAQAKHNNTPAGFNRRALLKLAPAALVAGAVPAVAVPAPADPMVNLVDEWTHAFEAWWAAAQHPDAGNFDTPECLYWDEKRDTLVDEMKGMKIATLAGFIAFFRFVSLDNAMGDFNQPEMQGWQWKKLNQWAEARALVA